MGKGLLKEEYKEDFEEELENLLLMRDYIERSGKQDERFSSLRMMDYLTLIDGGVQIPEIIVMQEEKGKTEVFRKSSKKHEADEIDLVVQKTGLEREDIIELLQDGLELQVISETAENLPFKEIAESAAIREMIRKDIKPEQLEVLKIKGLEIVSAKDGSLEIKSLEKVLEVDEKGMVKLEPELETSLEPFEQFGLISISKGLAIKQIEPKEQELSNGKKGTLKVVPLEKKREEKTKEEIEKEEIARALGESPENILSVIRIEDREGGSKLFNDSLTQNAKPLIVRFRNNNFKLMEELDDGSRKELSGFEATPVSKQVASLLKDTANNHDTYVKPGEIKAGKTNPNQERYDLYQIRRAGESKDDDSNNLLFVSFSGKTDLNLIENRTNGSMAFAKVPQKSIYPRSIYIEDNIGTPGEKEVVKGEGDNKSHDISQISTINYNDIGEKIAILEELKYVEEQIRKYEQETGHDERCARQHETHSHTEEDKNNAKDKESGDPDISDDLADNSRKLPELYSKRGKLLQRLGVSQSVAIDELEEEYTIGQTRRPH